MAVFRLKLDLERASGVLAGIVAKLAQQGLELKTQKLARDPEGRGGSLDIVAEGEIDDIAALVGHMVVARGVGEVVRIERDGEPVFADGEVIEALPDIAEASSSAEAADAEDIESEVDDFLDPGTSKAIGSGAPAASSSASTSSSTTDSDDWLESDPDADSPSMLQPEAGRRENVGPSVADDEDAPMLGKIDESETPDATPLSGDASAGPVRKTTPESPPASPPETPRDIADEAGSGWGDEATDDWETSLAEATRSTGADADLPDSAVEEDEHASGSERGASPREDREDASDDARDDARDDEDPAEQDSDDDAGHDSDDDGSRQDAPKGDKSRVEAIVRRRRRRRR